ncbi:CapA family protein [Bacillus taeanensis]|uniref:CapA family protein n=1 Tax=Bacillus taeanensis TaxID=273032 RepID=A0A366XS57_9BACI|nr:CapA family protein [Bacillus taeanensis]RBW67965.1 CapA family protein [Bacillus taeanensis]
MKKSLFYLTFLVLILILSSYSIITNEPVVDETPIVVKEEASEQEAEEKGSTEEEKPAPAGSTATLAAIGDILIHDRVYDLAEVGNGVYDFMPMLAPVQPYIGEADITVANQETMIGGVDLGLSSYPSFNSPYEVGDALQESGVDLVTLANNHTLDRGENVIQSALSYWDTLGIPYTGSFESAEDQQTIRTIEKNGIVFSFLAYTYGTNGIPVPADKPYLVNLIDWPKMEQEIIKAKQQSDVVVVSLHFGQEYERMPNEMQKELAHQAANTGADIVIGHHPHVLQPLEWVEREDGTRAFIAYSLGNFLSGQKWDYKDIGGIMQIKVEKTEANGEETIELKEPAFVPTFVEQGYVVYPLKDVEGKEAVYEEIKTHMSQWMPELQFSLE